MLLNQYIFLYISTYQVTDRIEFHVSVLFPWGVMVEFMVFFKREKNDQLRLVTTKRIILYIREICIRLAAKDLLPPSHLDDPRPLTS